MQRSRDQRQRLASIAFGAVLTCALVSSAHAQRGGASISMQASEETVEIGVPFTLEVTVSSESDPISEIVIPPLDGFAVVSQQMSSPTRMTITNGRRTVQREVVYRFQLVAERPGRIELAPASARVGRGTIRSESLTLKVIGAGSSNTPGPAAVTPRSSTTSRTCAPSSTIRARGSASRSPSRSISTRACATCSRCSLRRRMASGCRTYSGRRRHHRPRR